MLSSPLPQELSVEDSLDSIAFVPNENPFRFKTLLIKLRTYLKDMDANADEDEKDEDEDEEDFLSYINTPVLTDYLQDDEPTEYNAALAQCVHYITDLWGYSDRTLFEGVLHLFKADGDTIYWLCRFTDPLMRAANLYSPTHSFLLKADCSTMLNEARSSAHVYLDAGQQEQHQNKEKIKWVTSNVLIPFIHQGHVANCFYKLCQSIDSTDPVSVYFQAASWIVVLFVLERWQDVVRLVDGILGKGKFKY